LIDLHTHTTASDGRCTPDELVARASAAGVRVLAVTDHDTVAGCAAAADACSRAKMTFVPGIEVTAVVEGADVHVLGYFVQTGSPALLSFLAEQRQRRADRVREMIGRLAMHGIPLDADAVLAPALKDSSRSAGRPWIARALVEGGHVPNIAEAFNRWLSRGRPAFIARIGAAPEEVFERIHASGGIASLAHPVLVKHDEWLPQFAKNGLDALEVYHTDHDELTTAHYLGIAKTLRLGVSGGSDYHADDAHGGGGPGRVSLPQKHYEGLLRLRAARRASASSDGSVSSS
jgi:predicted metal-dependent phosphoesterase TrpH